MCCRATQTLWSCQFQLGKKLVWIFYSYPSNRLPYNVSKIKLIQFPPIQRQIKSGDFDAGRLNRQVLLPLFLKVFIALIKFFGKHKGLYRVMNAECGYCVAFHPLLSRCHTDVSAIHMKIGQVFRRTVGLKTFLGSARFRREFEQGRDLQKAHP